MNTNINCEISESTRPLYKAIRWTGFMHKRQTITDAIEQIKHEISRAETAPTIEVAAEWWQDADEMNRSSIAKNMSGIYAGLIIDNRAVRARYDYNVYSNLAERVNGELRPHSRADHSENTECFCKPQYIGIVMSSDCIDIRCKEDFEKLEEYIELFKQFDLPLYWYDADTGDMFFPESADQIFKYYYIQKRPNSEFRGRFWEIDWN